MNVQAGWGEELIRDGYIEKKVGGGYLFNRSYTVGCEIRSMEPAGCRRYGDLWHLPGRLLGMMRRMGQVGRMGRNFG